MYNLLPFINSSGITCPLFSLRYNDDFGIGDIKGGYLFLDFLEKSGLIVWKMLPINETAKINGFSPYDPISAFALDPIYVDITDLKDFDYKINGEYLKLNKAKLHQSDDVIYQEVLLFKREILLIAFNSFYDNEYIFKTQRAKDFQDYCNMQYEWLDEYACYKAIFERYKGIPLQEWPELIKNRDKQELIKVKKDLEKEILFVKYIQWVIDKQWKKLKAYANKKGIYLVGDITFYIGLNSADLWSNRADFDVDGSLVPYAYGGAPADDFSPNGQVWEVAVPNWKRMKENGYTWWMRRIRHIAPYFDGFRLDHFRGFVKYWRVDPKTLQGKWVDGPGFDFLNNIAKEMAKSPIKNLFVENLGVITEDVETMRRYLGMEGYVVFIYSYRDIFDRNISYMNNAQTTTHDTPPLKVWWKRLNDDEKSAVLTHFKIDLSTDQFSQMQDELRWRIIEQVLSVPFNMKLIPIQDIIGSEAIINIPNTRTNNWIYRMERSIDKLCEDYQLIEKLRLYNRIFNINTEYRNFMVRTTPVVNGSILRSYKVNEDIILWAFAEKESDVQAVTNLPLKNDYDIKEIKMSKIFTNDMGVLYQFNMKAKVPGEYFFTIKINGMYIGKYKDDIRIVIEQ